MTVQRTVRISLRLLVMLVQAPPDRPRFVTVERDWLPEDVEIVGWRPIVGPAGFVEGDSVEVLVQSASWSPDLAGVALYPVLHTEWHDLREEQP